jgi:hypothetical protein
MLRSLSLTALLLLPLATHAQAAKPGTTPAPIEDNSFLAEEAYNQERGVVQHISTFTHTATGRGWAYTFTQEWPAPTITHQLSYTVPLVHADVPGRSPHVGDLALNYRYQALGGNGVYFAPRVTAVLPTGSARLGTGSGGAGAQANLPLTLEVLPQLVTHTNVGGTLVPRGKTESGERLRTDNLTLAQSVIWLPRPVFNLMLEAVWSRTQSRVAGVDLPKDQSLIVSPGVRYAINRSSGLQIVPGLAFPVTMRGHSGDIDGETGVFLYLSLEHAFRHGR